MDHNLFCCYNNDHLISDAKQLACRKLACNICLNRAASYNGKLICKNCKQVHDLKNDDIVFKGDANALIENNLCTLCECLTNNLQHLIIKIKYKVLDFAESFENYIDFLDGEIELRIESVNIEIDNLEAKLFKKIEKFNQKYVLKMNLLKEAIDETLKTKCLKQINNLNYDLLEMEKSIRGFKQLNYFLYATDFIGLLKGPYLNIDKFSERELIIKDFKGKVQSLCVLSALNDKKILISDYKRNELYIFDKNFNEFERVSHVQGFKIRSYYGICTSDDFENIYLCDLEYSRILITNNNFNLIKKIIFKAGSLVNEFQCARDIVFYSDFLFILDQGLKCVFIFNKYGDFIRMFDLVDRSKMLIELNEDSYIQNCMCIGAVDDTIVIMDWKKSLFIYNFDGYLVNMIHHPEITSFCLKHEWLITHGEDGRVTCYMKDVSKKYNFIKIADRFFQKLKYRSESLILFNDKIVISMGWEKFLAVIMVT
jgi:hypothetical protein